MKDCIVVGGGLIGMLTARALQQAGLDVCLLEKGVLGGESTWAGGGILSPLYPWRYPDAVNALAKYSQQVYPSFAEELLDETGIDPEYTLSGLLVLDEDEVDAASRWAHDWDMSLLHLRASEELHAIDPVINHGFTSALHFPEIAQMRNPRLVKALKASLDVRGIEYYEHSQVTGMRIRDGKVQAVLTESKIFETTRVVIAGGAWSEKLLADYMEKPPEIEPVKGQMILFKARPGLLNSIVLNRGRYLIPRRDGRILAGSTLEFTGFEKALTGDAKQDLYQAACEIVPELESVGIEHHWAGLRPGSPNGVPYIGEHPEVSGLFINSGHYRNGVILGAASIALLKDLVLGSQPVINPQPYQFDVLR